MATLAGGVRLFGGSLTGQKDLCDVAAAFDVRLPRSMAALAGDALAAVFQSKLRMRIVREVLSDLRVASDASVGAHVAGRRSGGCRGSLRCTGLLAGLIRGLRYSGIPKSGECDTQRNTKKQTFHRASTFMVQQDPGSELSRS